MKISGEIGRDTVISLIGHYVGYLASAVGLGNSLHKDRCQYIHLLIPDEDHGRRQGFNTHFVLQEAACTLGTQASKCRFACAEGRQWPGGYGQEIAEIGYLYVGVFRRTSAETDLQLQVLSIPISQPP